MMVVVMMVPARRYHDPGNDPAIGVVMVVVMMVMKLHHLDIAIRRRSRRRLIDGLQHGRSIRDRFQKVGERTGPQHVGRRRTDRRGLGGIERPERRHRSQKSGDPLFHGFSSN